VLLKGFDDALAGRGAETWSSDAEALN